MLPALIYPLAAAALKFINFLIRRGFPDHLLLNDTFAVPPWRYQMKSMAGAVIVLVVGMFLGLWANIRTQKQKAS